MTPPQRNDPRVYRDVLMSLRESWLREGVELAPLATVAQVQDFERLHGVKLPEGLSRFLLEVGGMRNHDAHYLRVWPISEVALISKSECAAMGLPEPAVQFADYLMMSHVFAVHLGASEPVFITGGATARTAESLEAFMKAYLANPDSILFALGDVRP